MRESPVARACTERCLEFCLSFPDIVHLDTIKSKPKRNGRYSITVAGALRPGAAGEKPIYSVRASLGWYRMCKTGRTFMTVGTHFYMSYTSYRSYTSCFPNPVTVPGAPEIPGGSGNPLLSGVGYIALHAPEQFATVNVAV